MGFKFTHVCDLLSRLDDNLVLKATSAAKTKNPDFSTVINWFNSHEKQIHHGDTDRLALLSCLLPDPRPDRVYGFKELALVRVIGRCLLLGVSRRQELEQWRVKGGGDLGHCVECVMQQAENAVDSYDEVTVEEIDAALGQLASRCRFSAPDIRNRRSAVAIDDALAPIFRRLSSRDAKWFTRLLLKDYSPIVIPEQLLLRNFHFLFPTLLLFHDSIANALEALNKGPIRRFPSRPDRQYAQILRDLTIPYLVPRMGVKVGRPEFYKARSLKHCCTMAGKRTMSLERKYDGEYCQIHVDLQKGRNCIQIFSKSGKNSTVDRAGIHTTIRDSLRVGKSDCRFSQQCILEGELLVWSDLKSDILPFHKLRKHISRSGSFIGTENDSPPHQYEHLYIVFFDILLIDKEPALSKPFRERRKLLGEVVSPMPRFASLAEYKDVNFSLSSSYGLLKKEFAMVAAQRWEGLILRGLDEAYFAALQTDADRHSCRLIKFKKEYIPGLGDTADFAIIGARYDSRDAVSLSNIHNLSWTSFFVGCAERSTTSVKGDATFRVVDVLNKENINAQLLQDLNQFGQFQECDVDSDDCPYEIRSDQVQLPKVQSLFKKPFVVEMVGFGFEKAQGVRYFTLRFPRILKIHFDRTYEEAVSFDALQELARLARSVPSDHLSQEAADWAAKLDAVGGKRGYIRDLSQPSMTSTEPNMSSASQQSFALNSSIPLGPLLPNASPAVGGTPPSSLELKRKSTSLESNSGPKKLKPSRTDIPTIEILSDCTQTNLVIDSFSSRMGGSSQCLANVTNSSPIRDMQHGGGKKRNSQNERLIASKSPLGGDSSAIKTSKSTLSLTRSTSQSAILSSKRRAAPVFSRVPILLSSSLTGKRINHIRSTLKPSKPILPPTSTSRWLHSMKNATNVPHTRHYHRVVLVDSGASHAAQVASEITQIGNSLVELQQVQKLPDIGMVIFLHWKALKLDLDASSDGKSLVERWRRFAPRMFAGCLKWGYGAPECSILIGLKSHSDSVAGGHIDRGNTAEIGHDITASWDWEDVFPLLEADAA